MRSASWRGEFADRDTVVYGVSTDSEFVHMNWRLHHDNLRESADPDAGRHQARAGDGGAASWTAPRASRCGPRSWSIREGIIRFAAVNDLSVGRNPDEVLRVLDALQSDGG